MTGSVYRGEWTSEMLQWIGWPSDNPVSVSVKEISTVAEPVSDHSVVFSETKSIDNQVQFAEFGVPSSIWGQDVINMRSRPHYEDRFPSTGINMLKQEHQCFSLDSQSSDSLVVSQRLPDMPPLFPSAHGEETYSPQFNKPPMMGHSNQLLMIGSHAPLWKESQDVWEIHRSSGLSFSQKGQERPSTCNEAIKGSCMDTKKINEESAPKRHRSDTHAPFTTFKVRKEKLGDRITALQQLVSPFGKTDTASVLLDAIDYIKFLHDQVTVLTTPYMMLSHELSGTSMDIEREEKKGLRSRGLCLVPISTTLHVAKDNTTEFWSPTFGGSYR